MPFAGMKFEIVPEADDTLKARLNALRGFVEIYTGAGPAVTVNEPLNVVVFRRPVGADCPGVIDHERFDNISALEKNVCAAPVSVPEPETRTVL